MRFRIFPYNIASQSATTLRDGLRNLGYNTLKVLRDGRYRWHMGDKVINWGNSVMPEWMESVPRADILNQPENVGLASNKLRTLQRLSESGVPHIPFTTDAEEAIGWSAPIYVRHSLNGHSGEGIDVFENEPVDSDYRSSLIDIQDRLLEVGLANIARQVDQVIADAEVESIDELPVAPLYTKRVENDGEYRVHVFNGHVIDYRKKSRVRGDEPTDAQRAIRTLGNGWIYRQSDLARVDRIEQLAVNAISALGLDFGAVDIIKNPEGDIMVLEVNTAVGMDDTTLQNYVTAFHNYATGTRTF